MNEFQHKSVEFSALDLCIGLLRSINLHKNLMKLSVKCTIIYLFASKLKKMIQRNFKCDKTLETVQKKRMPSNREIVVLEHEKWLFLNVLGCRKNK